MLSRRNFLSFKPAARAAPRGEGFWLHLNRTAMACCFEVTLPAGEESGVEAARLALDEVDSIERQLTVYRETSEVSFVNRNAAEGPVRVEPGLLALLRLSLELYRETEGAFDVTSGPLTRCWGFFKRQGRVPGEGELEAALSVVGSDKLLLDEESRSVAFARAGVEINFGSIGKGYALDRVAASAGARLRSALLSAGSSSLRAVGAGGRGKRGWVVGVRDPKNKERRLAVLRLRECAMSTSGSEEQFFEHEGRRYGHIIDPRTGVPAEGVASVSVVADSAARSDALATAFYVAGPELAERYCASHPGTLALLLEEGERRPRVFGRNQDCEVELIDE